MKIAKQSIIFGSGFAGGLFTAFLISSLKNSDAFKSQKQQAEQVFVRMNHLVKENTEKLQKLNERIKKEFSDPLPDLYRATASLTLDEEELIYD